ncbi:MAG TPA: DUF3021 domain-containing protein [Candidatus Dormibacteraeota bacterium]|nr:DUF3021 domain-containing protein [Candidatus Dormibacteraeota bacterium]
MKAEVLKRVMIGIAYGGISTFIALTVLMILEINPPVAQIWLYTLAGFMLGIYFGVASFIFEIDKWSPLKTTVIHFLLSIAFYFMIALSIGWIPFTFTAIIISIFIFTAVYCIYWLGYRTYYKRVEDDLNKNLHKKKEL